MGGSRRSTRSERFLEVHKEELKPFVWTKTAEEILASIARFAQRTYAAHSH